MIAESSRFILWIPVFIGCGVFLYFSQNAPSSLWIYLFGACYSLILLVRNLQKIHLRFICVFLLAVMVGASASAIRLEMLDTNPISQPVFFKLVRGFVEDIQHKEKKTKLILREVKIESLLPHETPKRVSITVKNLPNNLEIGSYIEIPAMVFPLPSPVLPDAYDFARMFYFEELGAVGFSPKKPVIISKPEEDSQTITSKITSKITTLRIEISNHLVATMGNEAGAIASALMVGEQSRLSQEATDSMRDSGIYHIVSISGLHMALASGMVFFIIRIFLALIPYTALNWPNKKIAAVFALLAGALYLLLAGSPVPAVRSYIMVACVLVAVLFDRRGISLYSLGWAAVLILLIMPESLFSASFQLSFAATLAIVALYERYGRLMIIPKEEYLPQRFMYYILGLMLTSLAASLYTSPLAIAHFNRMAVYGVLANMLVVPLSSFIIMPSALIAFITMPFGLDSWPLAFLKFGIEMMMSMSRLVEHFPYANITLPPPTNWGFIMMVIGGLWLVLWISKIRLLGLLMIIGGILTIALFKPYDLIISDDARRVAYLSKAGHFVMIRGEVDSFEAEIWKRSQGVDNISSPTLSRKQAVDMLPEEISCDKTSCMITRGDKTVLIVIKKSDDDKSHDDKSDDDKSDDYCESGADIIITNSFLDCDYADDYANYIDDEIKIIDREFVKNNGAIGVQFENNQTENNQTENNQIKIITTNSKRGNWPWNVN